MKIVRLAGLVLVAVVAMSFAAVSSASAVEPLFKPKGGAFPVGVTGTSGVSILTANNGVDIIKCEKDVFSGSVVSSLLIGKAVVHYLNCFSSANGGTTFCPINTPGAPAGLILTNTLHGILGLILPSRETGILFLPVVGKTFVSLEEAESTTAKCTIEATISGNVAGLVTPTGKLQTTGEVIFTKEAGTGVGNEAILDIDLTHGLGLVKPQLTAFLGTGATLEQTEAVTFAEAVEVT
jgi:hypothetical protein